MASHDIELPETLDAAVRDKLRAGGIAGLDALWREIGKGEDHGGLAAVLVRTQADRPALIKGLTDYAVLAGEEKGKSWPRRHALDLLLIAALILLVGLVWRAVPRARSVGIAQRGLAVGERLGAGNLAGADSDTVSRWRVKRAVAKGTYVLPEGVEKVRPVIEETALRGRSRISFRVQPVEAGRLADLPALVSLVISSKGGNGKRPATVWLRNVPILAVERDEDSPSVTAALKDSEISALLPLLPEDRVYIVQPFP